MFSRSKLLLRALNASQFSSKDQVSAIFSLRFRKFSSNEIPSPPKPIEKAPEFFYDEEIELNKEILEATTSVQMHSGLQDLTAIKATLCYSK